MWESRPVNSVRHREVQIWKVKFLQSWLTSWFVQGMEVMHFTLAWRSFNNFEEKRWIIHLKKLLLRSISNTLFCHELWTLKQLILIHIIEMVKNCLLLPVTGGLVRYFFAVKCWGKNAIHTCSITVTVFAFYDIHTLPLDKKLSLSKGPVYYTACTNLISN